MKKIIALVLIPLAFCLSCSKTQSSDHLDTEGQNKIGKKITYVVFDDYSKPYFKIVIDTLGLAIIKHDSCGITIERKRWISKEESDAINKNLSLWEEKLKLKKHFETMPDVIFKENIDVLETLIINNEMLCLMPTELLNDFSTGNASRDSIYINMVTLLREMVDYEPPVSPYIGTTISHNVWDWHWDSNKKTLIPIK